MRKNNLWKFNQNTWAKSAKQLVIFSLEVIFSPTYSKLTIETPKKEVKYVQS